jgi:hypothetical protein
MTPQERQLLIELFDRLASLESGPRDPDAVQAINEGLRRAPNALYPLVQTALVQDEALKRADARIRELEDELGIEPPQEAQQGGFLDNMRDALNGRREPQGSVPTVKSGAPGSSPWSHPSGASNPNLNPGSHPSPWRTTSLPPSSGYSQQAGGYDAPQAGGYGGPQAAGSPGGSFLGTAAAAAAGAIGGSLLMNSFRGMFGGQHGSGQAFGSGSAGTPWAPSTGGGDLARDAGVNDIGGNSRTADAGDADSSQRAGLFDIAQNDSVDTDFDDDDLSDDGDFGDGGSDTA